MFYKAYEHYESRVSASRFDNARNTHMPVVIDSYKEAHEWWDGRADDQWRGTPDRPVGPKTHSDKRMRKLPDGTIQFEYQGHVLAMWHPDNTVTVHPFSNYGGAAFEVAVLPSTVETCFNSNLGKVIYLKRNNKPAHTRITLASGNRVLDPDILVVRAEQPLNLSFDKTYGRWQPTDPDDLQPFEWFELNKSEIRRVSEKFNISEFVMAIETALQMGAEIKTAGSGSSRYYCAITNTVEEMTVLELLEEGRYVDAAQLVRINQTGKWNGTKTVYETTGLKQTDIKKIRHMAYAEMGAVYLEQQPIISLANANNVETKIRDFGKPVTDRVL